MMAARLWSIVAGMAMVMLATRTVPAAETVAAGSASGLPIPRFVSLKTDRVNVRAGPTKDHDVTWVYTRAALPVEITAEFENWRRIRDWEGAEGWVYHSLLSGRRTAVVEARPKAKGELLALYDRPDRQGSVVARLEAGVLGSVRHCNGGWCHIGGEGFDGWIEAIHLWGVYPGEKVD